MICPPEKESIWSKSFLGYEVYNRVVVRFDVHFVVDGGTQQVTNNHTDRVFRRNGTVPDDMKHDGTALQAQYFKSAAPS